MTRRRWGLPAQTLDPRLSGSSITRLGAPNAPRSGCCNNWRCCPGSRCRNTRSSAPSDLRSLRGKRDKEGEETPGDASLSPFIWRVLIGLISFCGSHDLHIISLDFQLARRHYACKYVRVDICIKPPFFFLCRTRNNLRIRHSFNKAGLLSSVGWRGGGGGGGSGGYFYHSVCMECKQDQKGENFKQLLRSFTNDIIIYCNQEEVVCFVWAMQRFDKSISNLVASFSFFFFFSCNPVTHRQIHSCSGCSGASLRQPPSVSRVFNSSPEGSSMERSVKRSGGDAWCPTATGCGCTAELLPGVSTCETSTNRTV